MNKAFIFDLDGVLIDDEQIWEEAKTKLYADVLGPDVAAKLGSTLGINIEGIYERAVECGSEVSKEELAAAFYRLASEIYQTAPISEGLDDLMVFLRDNNFRVGIVSASPMSWIMTVVERLNQKKTISYILSLYDRPDLPHKPAPDGYAEAMQHLGVTPAATCVLEDSNAGIRSAKDAGAFTIGLRQNLVDGYRQEGADVYAETVPKVIPIIEQMFQSSSAESS